jgi:hypothetical protein
MLWSMSTPAYFKRTLLVTSIRDSCGRSKLGVWTLNGSYQGNQERFDLHYAENLADYRMGKRPPWKCQNGS